jgi:hypothetical protein
MSIFKVFKSVAKVGEKLVNAFERAVSFADRLIHKKEYERKARKRKIFWTILLSVVGGVAAVLLFPYRLIVKRNGDFEIRTLLLRVYRRSEDYDIPEGGSEDFEIADVAEETDAIEA